MADGSKIEWTEATWNPMRGCRRVSEGCRNCYAERQAIRQAGLGGHYEGLARSTPQGPRWTGEARFVPHLLDLPLRWRRPRRVFVDSMSDLFFEGHAFEDVARVFAVMAATPLHTYQVLTKRPENMIEVLSDFGWWEQVIGRRERIVGWHAQTPEGFEVWAERVRNARSLPNVWLGVSVEDQATADERIPLLLQCPAAVRWVSYEPALGPVDFWCVRDGSWHDTEGADLYNALTGTAYWRNGDHGLSGGPRLDWIVVGGESGPGARPFDLAWARSTIAQCRDAGVPVFVKQLGARPVDYRLGDMERVRLCDRKGGSPEEWPEDLRVRDLPEVRR